MAQTRFTTKQKTSHKRRKFIICCMYSIHIKSQQTQTSRTTDPRLCGCATNTNAKMHLKKLCNLGNDHFQKPSQTAKKRKVIFSSIQSNGCTGVEKRNVLHSTYTFHIHSIGAVFAPGTELLLVLYMGSEQEKKTAGGGLYFIRRYGKDIKHRIPSDRTCVNVSWFELGHRS